MDIKAFLASVLTATIADTSPWGLAGALVVACVWAVYLLRLPSRTSHPIPRYTLLLLLGAVSAILTIPFSSLLFSLIPLVPGQTWLHDLLITLIHIGLLEELFKFLPVLIVMSLCQQQKEPLDWIVAGSFSALGFATLENAIYFSRSGLGIVPARFLFTTLLHLATTGIITAAWVLKLKSSAGKSLTAERLGAMAAVIAAHAAFDFFILGPFTPLAPLSIVVLLALAWQFTIVVHSIRSTTPTHECRWLAPPAGNTFRLLFLSTLALLALSAAYTFQKLPLILAIQQIGVAILITIPVATTIFRWWGQLTQEDNLSAIEPRIR